MATIQSVKQKIQGLIDKSNEATGGSATDLSSAVDELIANQGGGEVELYEEDWLDDVIFWDYDRTMVARYTVEEAQALTELPTPPSHDGLTFQGWNYTLEEVQSATHFLDVGAVYIPTDENTHVKINLDNSGFLSFPIYFSTDTTNVVKVYWGDGSNETITTSGTGTLTHKYSAVGEYEIIISVPDGCTMTLGQGSSSKIAFGGTSSYAGYVREIYIGKNVVLSAYSIYRHEKCSVLTLPNGITEIPNSNNDNGFKIVVIPRSVIDVKCSPLYTSFTVATGDYTILSIPTTIITMTNFSYCKELIRLNYPESISELPNSFCQYCYSLKRVHFNQQITVIPSNAFSSCSSLQYLDIPKSVVTISDYSFSGLINLRKLEIPEGVTEIPNSSIGYLYNVQEIVFPRTLISIGNYFSGFNMRKIVFPEGLTKIGKYALEYSQGVEQVVLPSTITEIGSGFLDYGMNPKTIVFKGDSLTSISFGSTNCSIKDLIFTSPSKVCPAGHVTAIKRLWNSYHRVYINDEAFETYYNDSNLKTYNKLFRPLSEYPGERFWED